ncbi:MAG: DUF3179 domain-containing protein [Deinococcota bacterium]
MNVIRSRHYTLAILILLGSVATAQPMALSTLGVDATQASIPLNQVFSGGPPPQGIPALGFSGEWQGAVPASNDPVFVSQEDASEWLGEREPVIAFVMNGEARAYPLQVLTWHEIANDVVGGVPVSVTFCPLCNSALAFDRRIPVSEDDLAELQAFNEDAAVMPLDEAFIAAYERQTGEMPAEDGIEVTFGVSGMLYKSNMLMFDSDTSTLWSQLSGDGNVGALTETILLRYPAQIVGFGEFRDAFPDAFVLSRETGYSRGYGRNPYVGYDDVDSPAFLFRGEIDGRLTPKARVISVFDASGAVAYPFEVLAEARVVNDSIGDSPVVVFWQEGTQSALDGAVIAESEDVGGAGIFSSEVDGQVLEFSWDGETFTDTQTGSTWNLLGQATAGELAGSSLTPIVHDNTLWFSWAAFMPDTRIYSLSE